MIVVRRGVGNGIFGAVPLPDFYITECVYLDLPCANRMRPYTGVCDGRVLRLLDIVK